jgi:RPA family protein
VNVSLRPESISVVDAATRDRWVVETAERTLDRIESFDGADEYAAMAETQYEPDLSVYRDAVIAALEDLESDDEVPAEA